MLTHYRLVLCWLMTLLVCSPAIASTDPQSADVENACTAALSQLESRINALLSITATTERLSQGTIDNDFTFASILTVDLLDQDTVQSRLSVLATPVPDQLREHAKGCDQPELAPLARELESLQARVNTLRTSLLSLPYQQRATLTSLASVHHRLAQRLSSLNDNVYDLGENIRSLQDQLQALETRFQVTTDATQRSRISNQVEAINSELAEYQQKLDTLQPNLLIDEQLLHVAKALLRDAYGVFLVQDYSLATVQARFQAVASVTLLRQLLVDLHDSVTPHDQAVLNDFATLTLLSNQILVEKNRHTGLLTLLNTHWRELVARAGFELQSLIFLPAAHWHLLLQASTADTPGLSVSPADMIVALIIQLVFIIALWHLLKRVPRWVGLWQQSLARQSYTQAGIRILIGLLRIIQPNIGWITALVVFAGIQSTQENGLQSLYMVGVFAAVVGCYLLLKTLAIWPITNMTSLSMVFVSRKKQADIEMHCTRFAATTTFLVLWLLVLRHFSGSGVIVWVYTGLLVIAVWLLNYQLIAKYITEFEQHLSKRVSEASMKRFHAAQKPFIRVFVNPVVFALLQAMDLLQSIHGIFMQFEFYQVVTAKVLKLRLEQSASGSDTELPGKDDSVDDLAYENWFLDRSLTKDKPELIIKTSWAEQLDTAVSNWIEGKQEENDLLLTGDSGAGKSTLIHHWVEQWDASPVVVVNFPDKVTDPDELLDAIYRALGLSSKLTIAEFVVQQTDLEKTVIILEHAHNVFIGDVGGFEAYKKLHALLSSRLSNIFWIVVMNQQSWVYLNDVFGHFFRFTNYLQMQRWSQLEIRELILTRHKASRRRLRYDALLLASTSHTETANHAAESRCISLLWEQSAGNPAIALAIWANAARTQRSGLIEMGIPERPGNKAIMELSDEFLFVYAAIVVHESLTAEQIQASTHLPEAVVRRAIKLGLDQDFLERHNNSSYGVAPLWYLQLYQLLKRKNFLHE